MKTLIVCVSTHHGNTKKVADAMAGVLHADVVIPGEVTADALADYDIIGFGSGIAYGKHYTNLLEFVDSLPTLHREAFIFSTRGARSLRSYHQALKEKLIAKGCEVIGEFSCRGFDTYGPAKIIGGIARGRPNEQDLRDAQDFARTLERG
jgi:flavodoxin